MNKTELINKIAAEAGLSKADAKKALDATVTAIKDALAAGDKVALIGFGTFSVKERPAREAKRRLSFGEQKEYAEIEGVIASKEGELKVVRLEMQQNASDYTRLAELGREETRLAAELDHLMERWAYLEEIAEQQDS